jgi:hypothetical protein
MEFFTWPVITLILGIFALLLFRKPFSRFIDRTEKISKDGFQARSGQDQLKESSISKVDDFMKAYDNPLLIEQEKLVKNNLESLQPRDEKEKEIILIRSVASFVIIYSLEKTYNNIYGSQIMALHYMSDNRAIPLTIENIRHFYEDAKNNFSSFYANYSFESWLHFMVVTGLVQQNGNDIGITVRGKEFLKYLLDQGYSFIKAA